PMAYGRRVNWRDYGVNGRAHCDSAGRHQTHPRVFDYFSTRFDDGFARRGRRRRRMLHLLAHGFFKALLFLGAGSVIHGCHGEQDIRKMGGLRGFMPVTFVTYAIGMMALSGVPFFFSGGWTKEEILHATGNWPRSHVPYYLMLAGVILTALYMTRQMIYVFFGKPRA